MNATELRQKLHVIINDIPEKSCWTVSTEHLLKLVEDIQKAAQPKREWVGLSDEDIDDLWKTEYFNLHYELPKAVESKLKEKNCECSIKNKN